MRRFENDTKGKKLGSQLISSIAAQQLNDNRMTTE